MTNLKKEDGREINNEDEILAYVHSYYTELYSQPQVQSTAIQEQSEVLSLIDRFVTERENGILLVSPGEAELEDTVKKLPNCKAPGEDGHQWAMVERRGEAEDERHGSRYYPTRSHRGLSGVVTVGTNGSADTSGQPELAMEDL
ncbi:hypothetical protein R1sor_017299 [Riccia sorocarpa]|uniref:Uncharacterized protein n=1 Tax=Riccia sorocarpa TaxID=122646 RepID=A0ABD3I979_9MARC